MVAVELDSRRLAPTTDNICVSLVNGRNHFPELKAKELQQSFLARNPGGRSKLVDDFEVGRCQHCDNRL